VNATTLPPSARDVSFVFQQYSLYPHLSVRDNLAFPLKAPGRKLSKDEIARRVEATAKMVRIDHKLESRATRLSGGEMQRVAIGRAIVHRPRLILADEPTGNLDSKTGEAILQLIREIHETDAPTIVMATHSDHAASFGQYVVRVTDGHVK
jgi:multiple sugar transport system ATP-binding protein